MIPNATAVVCVKPFDERFIFREDRIKRDDRTELAARKKNPWHGYLYYIRNI